MWRGCAGKALSTAASPSDGSHAEATAKLLLLTTALLQTGTGGLCPGPETTIASHNAGGEAPPSTSGAADQRALLAAFPIHKMIQVYLSGRPAATQSGPSVTQPTSGSGHQAMQPASAPLLKNRSRDFPPLLPKSLSSSPGGCRGPTTPTASSSHVPPGGANFSKSWPNSPRFVPNPKATNSLQCSESQLPRAAPGINNAPRQSPYYQATPVITTVPPISLQPRDSLGLVAESRAGTSSSKRRSLPGENPARPWWGSAPRDAERGIGGGDVPWTPGGRGLTSRQQELLQQGVRVMAQVINLVCSSNTSAPEAPRPGAKPPAAGVQPPAARGADQYPEEPLDLASKGPISPQQVTPLNLVCKRSEQAIPLNLALASNVGPWQGTGLAPSKAGSSSMAWEEWPGEQSGSGRCYCRDVSGGAPDSVERAVIGVNVITVPPPNREGHRPQVTSAALDWETPAAPVVCGDATAHQPSPQPAWGEDGDGDGEGVAHIVAGLSLRQAWAVLRTMRDQVAPGGGTRTIACPCPECLFVESLALVLSLAPLETQRKFEETVGRLGRATTHKARRDQAPSQTQKRRAPAAQPSGTKRPRNQEAAGGCTRPLREAKSRALSKISNLNSPLYDLQSEDDSDAADRPLTPVAAL